MLNNSLKVLSSLLTAKKISSVELTQEFLKRIQVLNPKLNAWRKRRKPTHALRQAPPGR
jgi:aspartyl-tRNA(Asn)/glutamyl-tRNA(Gln) amidotransferase subunit A